MSKLTWEELIEEDKKKKQQWEELMAESRKMDNTTQSNNENNITDSNNNGINNTKLFAKTINRNQISLPIVKAQAVAPKVNEIKKQEPKPTSTFEQIKQNVSNFFDGLDNSVNKASEHYEQIRENNQPWRKGTNLGKSLANNEEYIESLSNMSKEDRNKEIRKMTGANREDYGQINTSVEEQISNKKSKEKAEKINTDLKNGDLWSATKHIGAGIIEGAKNSILNDAGTLASLNGEDTTVKALKTLTSERQKTTSMIENDVTRTLSGVSDTIGQMIPGMATSVAGLNGNLVSAIGAGSSTYMDNINEDNSNKGRALISGLSSGGASFVSEKLTGGNILSEGALDDITTKWIDSNFSSKFGKRLASKAYDILGENAEELFENTIQYLTDAVVNQKGTSLDEILKDTSETVKQTTLTTVILSMLGLGGDTYNKILENTDAETKQKISELTDIVNNEQNGTNKALYSSNEQITNNTKLNSLNQNVEGQNIKYEYIKSDNQKIDKLRQDISNNTNWNNSEQTKNYVNMLEKIITDKDIEIRLDFNLQTQNGQIANGSYKDGVITINPNSDRAGEFIAVHELTHAIGTDQMKSMIQNYRNSNAEFDSAVKNLLEDYKIVDINEEALSDISGQLFGNQEFINNIANTQPNIFKKIYNEIKYLWHQFRGYKNQDQFIDDLYYKWTQAYSNSNKINSNSNFSIQENSDGSKYIRVDTDQDIFEGINKKDYNKIAKMYIQDYLMEKTTLNNTDSAVIDIRSANKYTHPGKKQQYFDKKMKLTPELKNVLEIAQKDKVALPSKENSKYKNWEYYKFNFELGGKNFEGTVNIGIDSNGNKHFYEVNKIKEVDDILGTSLNRSTTSNINNSITPSNTDVNTNTKYSIQESENNSSSFNLSNKDNKGRNLSKEQQEYFKNSKVLDKEGKLKTVYHTTTKASEQFNIFDPRGTDFYRFGDTIVNYYTDSKVMSGSYADGSYEMAQTGKNISNINKVKRQYEGYINITNPYIIDAKNSNWNRIREGLTEYGQKLWNEIDILEKNNLYYELKRLYDKVEYDSKKASERFREIQKKSEDGQYEILGEYARFGNIDNIFNDSILNDRGKELVKKHLNDKIEGKTLKEIGLDLYNNKYDTLWKKRINEFKNKNPIIKDFTIEDLDLIAEHYTGGKVYIENRYLNKKTTNDIVKEVIEMNKRNSNYDGVIIKNVVDYGGRDTDMCEPADVYVTFNSNQFKNIDNTTPTDNPDIRYSKENQSWREYLEDNFKATGTRTDLEKIKLPTKEYFKNKEMQEILTDKDYEVLNKIYEKDGKTEILTEKKKAKILEKYANDKYAIKDSLDILAQKIINKGHYIDKLSETSHNPELKFIYDKNLNSFAEGQYVIGVAQTDNKGNKIGKSINDIWKPIEDSKLTKEFSEYLLHKHNVDRSGKHKYVFGEEIGATESTKIALDLENKHPEFKKYSEEIKKFNHNNLNNLQEAGLLTQDTIDYIESMYPNYIAISRNFEDSLYTGSNNKTGTTSPLKKATGGNSDIQPLKDTMAQQVIKIKRLINQNELGKELAKSLKNAQVDQGADIELSPTMLLDMNTMVDTDTNGDKYYLYFENGKQLKLKINDNLYESLKPTEINRLEKTLPVKALQKVNNIHRSLLTSSNPLFIVTNFFKDFQDGAFNSKYSSKFIKNYGKALNEIYTKGKYYESYMSNGGMSNSYFDYETGIKKKNKFVEKIRNANEIVEQLPRLAEFISTLEDGKSLNEALYNAAEITTNFKRGGDLTKAINRNGVNFLNASIQGLDKQFRNFSGQNGVRGYTNLLLKATIMGIAPSILNHILLDDDDEYQDLPQSTKDLYYLFKYNNGKFIRIPKGRVLSIFGSVARRTLEATQGQEDAWEGLGSTITNQIAPNNPLENNILAPIIQVKNNKTWYGSDLVSSRLQKELPENQYDETTDNFSKWLGKQIKASPKKINYIIDQYSGGIGDILLPTITPQAKQNVFVDKFTTDSVLKNKNVSKFYETLEKQTQIANDNFATEDDAVQLKYLNSINKEMGDLYKEKREIQMSSMQNKDKTNKVKEIQTKINELAEKGLANYRNVTKNEKSFKIENTEYYKNGNEIEELTDEEKEKNKNINIETYSDYKSKLKEITQNKKEKGLTVKNSDKINILLKSNYSNIEKEELYRNYINTEDNTYNIIKNTQKFNINNYLNYRLQDFSSDKEDDGTVTGKTISGSAKNKFYDYIDSANFTYNQKLLLTGMKYKTTAQERENIFNIVNEFNLTAQEKLDILKKMKGFTVYKDGTVDF